MSNKQDTSYAELLNMQKYLASLGLNQSSHQTFSSKIAYSQTSSCLYGPQTLKRLSTESKYEQQHIQEKCTQMSSVIRYVPQLNIFLYNSQGMSSPQSGQVHMMVMPKCKEPAKSAVSKASAGAAATPKKERVPSKVDSKQENSGNTPNTKRQAAE